MTVKGSVNLFSRKTPLLKAHKFSWHKVNYNTQKKKKITVGCNTYLKIKSAYLFLWLSRKPFPGFLGKYIA